MADTLINEFCKRTENSWLSKFQQAWSDSISTGGFVSFNTRDYPSNVGILNWSKSKAHFPSKFLFNGYDTRMSLKLFWPWVRHMCRSRFCMNKIIVEEMGNISTFSIMRRPFSISWIWPLHLSLLGSKQWNFFQNSPGCSVFVETLMQYDLRAERFKDVTK